MEESSWVRKRQAKPSDAITWRFQPAPFTDCEGSPMSHSFHLPTVHRHERSEFNTMANTLHYYQLQHALTGIFLYPRASENLGDVSQKAANQHSSSIRTMKSLWPIRGTPGCLLANRVQAPPRVMLESRRLKTLRIAYVPSHTAIAEHWDPAVVARVSITHANILSLRNDDNIRKYLERVFTMVECETWRWFGTFSSLGNAEKNQQK